jgi:hypothetical protein
MYLSLCNTKHPEYSPRQPHLPCRQVGQFDHKENCWTPLPDCEGCNEEETDGRYIAISRINIQKDFRKSV